MWQKKKRQMKRKEKKIRSVNKRKYGVTINP